MFNESIEPGSRVPGLLVIGAHPDDAEYKAGGLSALWRRRGGRVKLVSVTNGEAGHHEMPGSGLVDRRRDEARRAASTIGAESEVWDTPDGRLVADLPLREQVIRTIRSYAPDLVLTHRPNDYHPDHRATSLLVQDACYLVTVPAICPDVPRLERDPVVAYLSDRFEKPYPFTPTVVLDIGSVWDLKLAMLDAHASQFYEWLPFNMGVLDQVPQDSEGRRAWLDASMRDDSRAMADRYRTAIVERNGEGSKIELVEAFEGCEYGAPLDERAVSRLFGL